MILPIIFLFAGFILWYFFYGCQCFLNGDSTWAHPIWMPFQCFWQELWWILPGGLQRRAEFVRDEVIGLKYRNDDEPMKGYIMGSGGNGYKLVENNGKLIKVPRSWSYQEVVKNNRYLECAKDILPGLGSFVVSHVVFPLLPLSIWLFFHLIFLH